MGIADSRVADDEDDTPDQGRWRGKRRLTQLDAPADALHEPEPLGGPHKTLTAQHTKALQPFNKHLGVDAILHSKLMGQE